MYLKAYGCEILRSVVPVRILVLLSDASGDIVLCMTPLNLSARTIDHLAEREEIQSVQVADKSNVIICPSPAIFLESSHSVRPFSDP